MADGGVGTLRERVEQAIAGSGDTVVARVVDSFVDTEVKRRADILTAAVNTHRQMKADLNKIKPDHKLVTEDGTVVQEAYTPGKQKERAGHIEKMDKLDTAVATAVASHTGDAKAQADAYQKLEEAIKKASSKGGDNKGKGGAAEGDGDA
jgi:hypothetical protein